MELSRTSQTNGRLFPRLTPIPCTLLFLSLVLPPLPARAMQTQSPSAPPKPAQSAPPQPPASSTQQTPATPDKKATSQPTHITPEQAKQLFSSVDSILQFDSHDTGLPILQPVKRRLVTRDEVEQYLTQQLHNDRDAKRLERSELVLKKFGLLDPDFQLRPFMIRLLREQIAGYYDDKTKTVNLLDWIPPDEQKPVLAHELTHALQDQHIHLDKWGQQSDLSIAKNVQQDNQHIATDEDDTARDAVIEGQAMAVFVDYTLAPTGKNILTAPGLADRMNQAMSDNSDSPTLANAPLVLQRSLLFPYMSGMNFVRTVLAAKGKQAAFAGVLDHPPASSYEIMTPSIYLNHKPVPLLRMPDIHPLIDAQYRPYDVGVMGEFDVQLMTELFGGAAEANALAPAWRGGIYYAAQSKAAKTNGEQDSLHSLALLYLSRWTTPQAAQAFAAVYAREISHKYDDAVIQPSGDDTTNSSSTSQVWKTAEGPVLIVVSGRTVFISESFLMDMAHKLQFVMMGSIADSGGSLMVQRQPVRPPLPTPWNTPGQDLTACLRRLLFAAGIPRVALGDSLMTTGLRASHADRPGSVARKASVY